MVERDEMASQVHAWEEVVEIPTYGVGEPEQNPLFLEKRVYQGSSGKVYPYPVIETILDECKPQPYRLIVLENDFLRIEILPELGGRVYRALDKTNNYDFVYYNRVIKPALVGLAGPWISGGIEFNWPQHHRPNTFGPVEYTLEEQAHDRKTLWISEIDRMYGTKMTAGFTLSSGKAYLEIQVQLYNRTPEPQTFLWWANPAVVANDDTQSVFPPDVHAVFDHGRRDVSAFPLATSTYYKVDYSAGVDISWYKNIPVPTSYMAYRSTYDFIGGYDHARRAGLLHIANHHLSPGKKQWTWGNGAFGRSWNRNLTDQDEAYIELMVGVYTDNQPDFSWLQPYEEKSFKQYFMPYKDIGIIKNASIDAAVNLEIDSVHQTALLRVYATSAFPAARILLAGKHHRYIDEEASLSPTQTFSATVALAPEELTSDLAVTVTDAHGHILVAYREPATEQREIPEPAHPLASPEELLDNEALYLAGKHLEQYRHATFEPDLYYLEGLKRDPGDSRINVAYGTLLLRRGLFAESEGYFRRALVTLTRHNPNPSDGEASYQLGLALHQQMRLDEAFAAYYKSTWSAAWQDAAYYALAQIACMQGRYAEALDLVEHSLLRNLHNYQARHLKTILLRKLDRLDEALCFARETLQLDITDFAASNECLLIHRAHNDEAQAEGSQRALFPLMRHSARNAITLATDYGHAGCYREAIDLLHRFPGDPREGTTPLLQYYLAYFSRKTGDNNMAQDAHQLAREASPKYCFPTSLDDLVVLEHALASDAHDGKAHYYLGNLLYDKKRHRDALRHWEASRKCDATFATVQRNLALGYFNILHEPERALHALEQAFAIDPTDARILYELDQLHKRQNVASEKRRDTLERHWELVVTRDDLYLEYVTLLNSMQEYKQAIFLLRHRRFHPWEGGEGTATRQYVFAHVEIGKQCLLAQQGQQAVEILLKALNAPENLGEGKLAGAQENHVQYYLGCAYRDLGEMERATNCFHLAAHGIEEPASALFYNDQPPEMIFYQGLACLQLDDDGGAYGRFSKLIAYGEQHLADTVKIDYFAVSLPDFQTFEVDLQRNNTIHCHYMQGLGYLGLQASEQAREHFAQVLTLESGHQGASVHIKLIPAHGSETFLRTANLAQEALSNQTVLSVLPLPACDQDASGEI